MIRCEDGVCRDDYHDLIGEEPLLIRVEGEPYSVVMRTPGEEIHHAAGFCLGEGLVDSRNDFLTVGYCQDLDPNVIDVKISPGRLEKISDLLDRRGFISQTSCGICGKEMVKDLFQIISPIEDNTKISIDRVFECVDLLPKHQSHYKRTRGSHAAMLFDYQLEILAFAEDVGRHNALDKAIGKALMSGKLPEAFVAILSSRLSYELIQKLARARLPVTVSNSRPTALAAEMGRNLNMTLACTAKESELILICGEHRIIRE
ncbi:formate dehydrogenase accessory sulfurtransferase FdhD [Thermodesulfobacteriota bacterium]